MSIFDIDNCSLIGRKINKDLVVTQDGSELVLEPIKSACIDAYNFTLNIDERILKIFEGFSKVHIKGTHLNVILNDLDYEGIYIVCDRHLTIGNVREINNINLEGQFIYLSIPTTFNNCYIRAQRVFTYNNVATFNNCEIDTDCITAEPMPSWYNQNLQYVLNNSKLNHFIKKDTE